MNDRHEQRVVLGPRVAETAAMSRTQSLIWTSQRLHPEVPLANMGTRHRISGRLDVDRFERSFDAVVRACEVLRMAVADDPSRSGRIGDVRIHRTPPLATEVIDLAPSELDAWCERCISTPIDATSCVYDSVLLRHADDDWTWWLDLHHVATDARSSALVFEATSAAYEHDGATGFDLGTIVNGAFFDHVGTQARDEGAVRRAAAWGEDRAARGRQPLLRPYGARGASTTDAERVDLPLGPGALAQLDAALGSDYRALSRELGVLAVAALASAITIHRLDGRENVVVGVPVHHRSRGSAKVVGPFMELYPLTISVNGAATHREMFRGVLRSVMSLLRRAKPGESPDADFEIVLNVFTTRYGPFAGLPTRTEWMRPGHVDPTHLIRSHVFEVDGSGDDRSTTRWQLDVNRALSADAAAQRFPHHFAAAVEAILAEPDHRIGATTLVGAADLAQLALLNPAARRSTDLEPVHVQVARRLRASPDWIVAEQGDEVITAAEFDRLADRLASWLVAAGVDPGDRVGLKMPRGVDVLIAIHGVLRAGGAFVMIAPDDPEPRREFITRDADVRLILDGLPSDLDEYSAEPVDLPAVQLDDGAYILYTSGSTGQPKGVPISHRGLADYLDFATATYLERDEPAGAATPLFVALHSSLVFDLTVTSLFLSFLAGGRVVVFDEEPIDALGRIALDDRISFLKATPSQLELLTRLIKDPRALRTVVVGGEAFRRPVAERLMESCLPGVRIFNEYGPTEAVVGCMVHLWDPTVDTGPDVPIGHAPADSRILVLDRFGQLTPPGAWGELVVRRPGMAQGYLNRAALTAERFVELGDDVIGLAAAVNATEDGGGTTRWYRTGDRVRVERPGVATYGGRMDDQVKVNGIRLEPGEVEAALVDHPRVANALVRLWSPLHGSPNVDVRRCVRCGLGVDVPGVELDGSGVCDRCLAFDAVQPQTEQWFRTEADLEERLRDARRRRRGDIDCLHLLSGGKDSTYALYQLVERGWNVHAFTLDNGFISEGAKENIRRTCADLDVTHEFATTPAMKEIFRDSLDRYSNVCQGCYKTIYTLAVARAAELGIPVIVTGLSRGQFFETRLVPHQFERDRFDPEAIDRTVLEARRVYHRTRDAVTDLLPEQRVFDDDAIFEAVQFVDFYRYVDVAVSEVYRFLEDRAPWVRPSDTGRSTNCLINVAGIHVHRLEQGHHNYAEPYSWDVRLGHKSRDEALDELDDEIDVDEVQRLLAEVGYSPKANELLTAWYQSVDGADIDPDELRAYVRSLLPEHAVPSAFVRIDDVPLAASAKVDVSSLPAPTRFRRRGVDRVPPSTPVEARICEIWSMLLGLEAVGVTDDFFDLGGASLAALEAVAAIDVEFGTDLPDAAVFRARTVRELAAVVAQAMAELGDGGQEMAIAKLDPAAPAPLSAGEQAMLFEYRLDPGNVRYNVTRLYTIRGTIDARRFESAIRDVVMLHAPLHTSYAAARRALTPAEALLFEERPSESAAQFEQFAGRQRGVPFDLDAGPLVRVHVARTGPDEVRALIGLHHITIDAGTFDVFWSQIGDRYGGAPLAELEATYAEHAVWQQSRLREDQSIFWHEQTVAREPGRGLALRPAQPGTPDGYVSRLTTIAPAALAIGGNTPFAAAMAAAAATFARCAATDTIEFGITASTKDHPAAARLVGYYLNTLPMRLTVHPDDSFADLVDLAGARIADALPHRIVPFASMVREARANVLVPPDISFMLAYEQLAAPRFPGAQVSQRILAPAAAVTDVTLFVQERQASIEVGIEYRGSVLDEGGAERLLGFFEAVLVGGTLAPDASIGALTASDDGPDLVGGHLAESNLTVLDHLMARVQATPNAPAVIDSAGVTLSYRELAIAAERIARRIDLAVGTGGARRVGVAVERSAGMVAAVLGALSCGAAYVPLDPSITRRRLDVIASKAQLDAVIVGATTATFGVAEDRRVPVAAAIESTGDDLESLQARLEHIGTDDDAYLIFTSGSTGEPRGVAVTHRNLASSTDGRSIWYERDPARFLLTSSIGFDSSIVGLFWPLCTGGTVIVPGDDLVHDVDRLGALIRDRAVTHLLMVPSLYRDLLERAGSDLDALEVAIVAGEATPFSLVARHEQLLAGVDLVNEYGPTEATVWATAQRLSTDDGEVLIGGPIPGTTIRIVDHALSAVPEGVAGELLICGPGVTEGYVDDAEATAQRFVILDDRRWYRTGDLARTEAGRVSFLGRIDDQLNINGNRLEPGEVERELRRWRGVREAVVVAALDPPVLVAHLESDAIDESALRAALGRRLPASSVPRRFVCHPRLPRNANGKLDRHAAMQLPVPPSIEQQHGAALRSQDDRVDAVVAMWRSVMDRADITSDSDFFAVGGDSLSAVRIVTELGDAFGVFVPVAALLEARTPAGMAAALAGLVGADRVVAGNPFSLVTLREGDPHGPLIIMTPAWDDIFGYQPLAEAMDPAINAVALLYEELPGHRVVSTVDALVEEFLPRARGVIADHGRVITLGWSVGGLVAVELAERLAAEGHPVEFVAVVDTFFPGEERHLWSNRWWKYRSIFRAGAFGEAVRELIRELHTMGDRRARAIAARTGRKLLLWSGTALPDEPARTAVKGVPLQVLSHDFERIGTPIVFYAATTTNPERTLHRWTAAARRLVAVEVPGRHHGLNSIMTQPGVAQIANDLTSRLRQATPAE